MTCRTPTTISVFLIAGRVMKRKLSQDVAPSILAARYSARRDRLQRGQQQDRQQRDGSPRLGDQRDPDGLGRALRAS